MGLYNSDLVPVASTTITSNALISGAFKDVSINYTATGNEGGNGDIIVAFNVPASSSAGSYLDFNNVRLAVTIAPVSITNQPVSQTIVKGTNASFSVGALGSGVGYQWYYDTNTPVAGGTNSTLTLTNVQNGGTYDVVVTNSSGSVTSNIVNLIVQAGPSTLIDAQFGTSATQSGVAALGTSGDVWNAITGSTTNLVNSAGTPLVGAGLTLGSQGIFTDTGGSAMDVPTTALMEEYAYGITSPSKVSVGLSGLSQYEGDTFTLVVYAAGDKSGQGSSLKMTGGNGGNSGSTLNTTAISRQISLGNGIAYQTFTGTLTNGTLGITASIPSGGTYAIFNGFQLQLIPQAPAITTQPLSLSTNAGSSVTLSIAATGTTPGYRWYFDTNTPIIGATNSSLTLTNVRSSGTYDAVVSNSYGSSTSSIVKLTVLPNAPASLTSSTGTKSVTLTYSSVTNATFYVIYRSKVSGGPYTKLATTSATKYTDLNVVSGTTYYYVVVACDGLNLSSYSSQTSAEPH